jgi:ribosomal protein L7/L12
MPVEVLKCPNCGAPLQEINDITRCSYCHNVLYIHLDREGLNVRLAPGVNAAAPTIKADIADSRQEDEVLPPGEALTTPVSAEEAVRMAADICVLLHNGSRIPAIRLYRGRTGVPLVEAKNAVDALGQNPSDAMVLEKLRLGAARTAPTQSQQLVDQVKQIMLSGNEIEAVKLFRQQTDCSLSEAKLSVEAIAAGKPIELQPSSAGAVAPELPDALIRNLIANGEKDEAVRLYQLKSGANREQAELAIIRIENDLPSEIRNREAVLKMRQKMMPVILGVAIFILALGVLAFVLLSR